MLAEIEDALIAAIKTAQLGYVLGTVASYGGELADNENSLGLLVRQFPAVWITFNGDDKVAALGTAKDKWKVDVTFMLLVATTNKRGEKFTRHTAHAGSEVGAYQIIEDMRLLLLNQDLGLAIERFKPGPVKSLFNKKLLHQAMAIFSIELKTSYIITQPAEANQPDWLRTGFAYYLLPGDAVADATDLLTLRTP